MPAWPDGWTVEEEFDLDGYLAQPLVARGASSSGNTVVAT